MKHITGFIETAPLWKNKQFNLQQFEMPSISLKNFTSQPIPTNLRLGHQIEYIFKQLLDHSPNYNVLAHNIQIKKEKETIGEIDFIVEQKSDDIRFRESVKKLLHIELTYKFYIIDPNISEPTHRLIGPNRKDLFFTKMEKTRDKQLPLIYTEEGKKTLEKLAISSENIQQQVAFLGQLFTPYNKETPTIKPLNTACIVGFWISYSDFLKDPFKDYTYYFPQQNERLHKPHQKVTYKSHYDILLDITIRHSTQRSPMIWIKKSEAIFEKCFVVWW